MNDNRQQPGSNRRRITIRSLLALTLIVAIGFGWINAVKRAESHRDEVWRIQQRLLAANEQLELRDVAEKPQPGTRRHRFLYETNLEGNDFRGVNISAGPSAFQKTWLVDSQLQNTIIVAGTSSFQRARFDHANLQNAQLTGGGASFQLASFAGADLRNASLTGGGASFQCASLRDANLDGATINCPVNSSSFQLVDIDSASFRHADLSAIRAEDLESCYFFTPPMYDDKTRFPAGFDPAAVGWKLVQ